MNDDTYFIDPTHTVMPVAYKPLKIGTRVQLHDNLHLALNSAWHLVTGTIEHQFITDNGVHYEIRLDAPSRHESGCPLHTFTAHADNVRIL